MNINLQIFLNTYYTEENGIINDKICVLKYEVQQNTHTNEKKLNYIADDIRNGVDFVLNPDIYYCQVS